MTGGSLVYPFLVGQVIYESLPDPFFFFFLEWSIKMLPLLLLSDAFSKTGSLVLRWIKSSPQFPLASRKPFSYCLSSVFLGEPTGLQIRTPFSSKAGEMNASTWTTKNNSQKPGEYLPFLLFFLQC